MAEKIVVLNSGGFDSVCLLHWLKDELPDAEMHSLFFDYSQKAYKEEKRCAMESSVKLGVKFHEIKMPAINWSNSSLVSDNSDNLYLEMRNLIFLSYALSFAQSIEASRIYIALIEPLGYPDTSFEFIDNFNEISKSVDIEVYAPFHECIKEDLVSVVRKYGIKKSEFCSCFMTEKEDGEKCSNCSHIEEMYDNYVNPFILDDLFAKEKYTEMYNLICSKQIETAKIFINDSCNMNCSYCLTKGKKFEQASLDCINETWGDIMYTLYKFGIKTIDFMGKEPLIDKRIFLLIKYCQLSGFNFDFTFLTNGKTLMEAQVKENIQDLNLKKFSVSYDGITTREKLPYSFKELTDFYSVDKGYNIEISFDLHRKNLAQSINIIKDILSTSDISSIYIKPIMPMGENSYLIRSDYMINDFEFQGFIERLSFIAKEFSDKVITVSIPHPYGTLSSIIFQQLEENGAYKGIYINHDLYCTAGYDSIFITSDGYVYGCGNMVFSNKNTRCISKRHILTFENYEDLKQGVINHGFLSMNRKCQ